MLYVKTAIWTLVCIEIKNIYIGKQPAIVEDGVNIPDSFIGLSFHTCEHTHVDTHTDKHTHTHTHTDAHTHTHRRTPVHACLPS